ncbi:hypothetical protein [Microtetraspora fusca]|uniref:hypothetical protein n=1 Tax=Microtetraspora fusca TaxID=1997 RepID=UPI0012F98D20|nr:hypothetical protein [Microtetraspora fusca]
MIITISVLVAVPVIAAAADDRIEPCDVGQTCPPEVTVTITETPGGASPSQTGSPVVTATVTVTPTPSTSPTHSPTPSPVPNTVETTTAAPIPDVVDTTPEPQEEPKQEDPQISLPEATDTPGEAAAPPTDFGDPTPQDAAYELRNATPEFDQVTLSHKLAIPAALLVLIALFGWLIFEGRLRRMAHAAAVRKGGPAAPVPAAGAAYAPMVGFVPVPVAYPPAYGYPYVAEHPYGYPPQGYPQGYAPQQAYGAHPAYGMPQGYGVAPGYGVPGQQTDAWSLAVNEPGPAAAPRPDAPGSAAPGAPGADGTPGTPRQAG